MISSHQVKVPCSFTTSAPMLPRRSHRHSTAPVGSATTAMRPASITSNGGTSRVPPSSDTRADTASTSSLIALAAARDERDAKERALRELLSCA